VGFRILPDRIRVRNHNLRQGRKRLQQMLCDYKNGEIEQEESFARVDAVETA